MDAWPHLLLYLDLLVVPAGGRFRSSRQTAELVGVASIRIRAGRRRYKGIELVEISLHHEDMTTLGAHVVTLILQNLREEENKQLIVSFPIQVNH